MTGRTYSLAEIAAAYLPPEWVGPQRWLRDRLKRGEISGYRVCRVWRMTEDDVADFIAQRRNTQKPREAEVPPATSIVEGLSARARQRLRTAS
jgi:hypothetical protein